MEQGLYLMAVGMGTVFAFLTVLVMVMNVAGKLFERFGAEPEALPEAAAPTAVADDDRDIAVVLAAVEAWRRRNASGGQ